MFKNLFRLTAKALGTKEGTTDKEANVVALIRLLIVLQCTITNTVIVASNVHHW